MNQIVLYFVYGMCFVCVLYVFCMCLIIANVGMHARLSSLHNYREGSIRSIGINACD